MIYVTLAMDPIVPRVYIVGFGASIKDCEDHCERIDALYQRTFALTKDNCGEQLVSWLRECGVVSSHIAPTIRQIGLAIQEIGERHKSDTTIEPS